MQPMLLSSRLPPISLRRGRRSFLTAGTEDRLRVTGQKPKTIAPTVLQVLDSPACLPHICTTASIIVRRTGAE